MDESGPSASYRFLNGDVMGNIESAIADLGSDVGTFFTNNMGTFITIVGAFVAVGLLWWFIRFFTRARGRG